MKRIIFVLLFGLISCSYVENIEPTQDIFVKHYYIGADTLFVSKQDGGILISSNSIEGEYLEGRGNVFENSKYTFVIGNPSYLISDTTMIYK